MARFVWLERIPLNVQGDRRDSLFSWRLPLDHAKTVEEIPVAAAPHPMTVWPTR